MYEEGIKKNKKDDRRDIYWARGKDGEKTCRHYVRDTRRECDNGNRESDLVEGFDAPRKDINFLQNLLWIL